MRRAALALAIIVASPLAQAADAGGTAAPAKASDRLPEDPVAGARSSAEWRTFMAAEERERRLHYDRGRLKQHRAVLRLLRAARTRYDRARVKAAVEGARARFSTTAAEVRRRLAEIDHWGNNSNLLADYDGMLRLLADDYPAARLVALDGDGAPLGRVRADFVAREKKVAAWLAEAAASKDE